jgi:phosphatidate cytidylyltransferase
MAGADPNAPRNGEGSAGTKTAARNPDLGIRLLSAAVMLVLAGAALWVGGLVLDLFITAVAVATFAELAVLLAKMDLTRPRRIAALLAGLVYIGWAAAVLMVLPGVYVLLLVGVVVCTDSGAFFAGRAIGGPKVAPRISPSKTWAGLIGGMIAAALWVALAIAILQYALSGLGGTPPSLSDLAGRQIAIAAAVGAGLAVAAQTGDFFESWLKRRAGVKDSSNLIPGHGGVFDRVDGLLPVAIVAGLALIWTS